MRGESEFHAGRAAAHDDQAIATLATRGRHNLRPRTEKRIQGLDRQKFIARTLQFRNISLAADIERQQIVFDRLPILQVNAMPIGIQPRDPILDYTYSS